MLYVIFLFTIINGLLDVLIYKLLSLFDFFVWCVVESVAPSYIHLQRDSPGWFFRFFLSWPMLLMLIPYRMFFVWIFSRIFGLFSVPRKWYAIVYLILMSVLIPGVSFVGHLCGIISGYLFVFGYLNWLIPMHCLVAVEKSFVGSLMKKSSAFVYIPEQSVMSRFIFLNFMKW